MNSRRFTSLLFIFLCTFSATSHAFLSYDWARAIAGGILIGGPLGGAISGYFIKDDLLREELFKTKETWHSQTMAKFALIMGANPNKVIACKPWALSENKETTHATPLMIATTNNKPKLATLLIKYKADINAQESGTGLTPLHLAAMNQNDTLVKMLLCANANTQIKNKEGITPLHFIHARHLKNQWGISYAEQLENNNDYQLPKSGLHIEGNRVQYRTKQECKEFAAAMANYYKQRAEQNLPIVAPQ